MRREEAVLRVYLPGRDSLPPERAQCEFRTIELVQAAGVPSARPLFLDAEGAYLGEPAMLLSYLPGPSMYRQQETGPWVAGLAGTMRSIHAVTPERFDLSCLPRYGPQEIAGTSMSAWPR